MKAFGTTIQWNAVAIAKIKTIPGLEATRTSIDDTTHDSAGGITESLPGLISVADLPIEGYFKPSDTTGQLAMWTDFLSGVVREFIITLPAEIGATWTANGWLKAYKAGNADIDGNIPFTATIAHAGGIPVLGTSATAGMSALAISGSAVVTPTFAIGTFDYTANVLTAVASVTFTPTSAAGTITIVANGASQTVTTAQASSAIALGAAGSITPAVVTITQAGKTPKVYTVRVVRGV